MEPIKSIPKEKFQFVSGGDRVHDKKLATKPSSYLHDAFKRFCKNKGSVVAACIILLLLLYALFAPIFSPYTVSYSDTYFRYTLPKSNLFSSTNFWDGCSEKEINQEGFNLYYCMGLETGHNAVKNQEYTVSGKYYTFRLDSYNSTGCIYKNLTVDEYNQIQAYQNETGRQVIYPTVAAEDRPTSEADKKNANYWFKTTVSAGKTATVYADSANTVGNVIPVYKTYLAGAADDAYNSIRIEGEDGFIGDDGNTYYYAYGILNASGYEVRLNYYEYYVFNHVYVLKDGITEPCFLFGTTNYGQDIFTCLASGARFSFLFATGVALVNLIIGAIYGAIEGYYGGKIDLVMERISDILSAVPFMIVITLLKLYMGSSAHALILFLAFFITGWIGMASTTRMQFYRYKNQEYVLAARTLGAKDRRIMFKHIFPNALGTLITSCVLIIPSMIYSETNLTYLGIINLSTGNMTSVGTLLASGQPYLTSFPHIILFPSLFLALLMLSFNLFGNGLRDAFNPSLRGTEG